jgi:hypothetical protein
VYRIYEMQFITPFLLLLAIPGFLGCGAASIYNSSYYSETKLDDDLLRVTFQGGSAPMAGDLCLLRCAELTLSSGKGYFQVVDFESGNSIRSSPSSYPFHRHQIHGDPMFEDFPFATKTIRVMEKEPLSGFAYDARVLSSTLKRKYKIDGN